MINSGGCFQSSTTMAPRTLLAFFSVTSRDYFFSSIQFLANCFTTKAIEARRVSRVRPWSFSTIMLLQLYR